MHAVEPEQAADDTRADPEHHELGGDLGQVVAAEHDAPDDPRNGPRQRHQHKNIRPLQLADLHSGRRFTGQVGAAGLRGIAQGERDAVGGEHHPHHQAQGQAAQQGQLGDTLGDRNTERVHP